MSDSYAQIGSDGRPQQQAQNVSDLVRKEMDGIFDTLSLEMNRFNNQQPAAIKASVFIAPGGLGLLLIATFLAGHTLICKTSCIHTAEMREERLLDCEEKCILFPDKTRSCKDKCAADVGYTRRTVRRARDKCSQACDMFPFMKHASATLGVILVLTVTPLLGSYKHSCRCECCLGEGCSARLALLNVAWGFFALGCLWVLPAIMEDSGELGGKVLFGLSHVVAMGAMWSSRAFAERTERMEHMKKMRGGQVAGAPYQQVQMATMVGQPIQVSNPEVQELQEKVVELQEGFKELRQQVSHLAGMRNAEAVTVAVSAVEAPPAALAAAPTGGLLDL